MNEKATSYINLGISCLSLGGIIYILLKDQEDEDEKESVIIKQNPTKDKKHSFLNKGI